MRRGTGHAALSGMRIGVDGAPLLGRGGISRYLCGIAPVLARLLPGAEFVAYVDREPDAVPLPEGWLLKVVPRKMLPSSYAWLRYGVSRVLVHDAVDVFWGVRTLLPLRGARVWVTTVHDLNLLLVPDTMPFLTYAAHRLWMRRDVGRAHVRVAVSSGTARRLSKLWGVDVHAVAPPGVDGGLKPVSARAVQEVLARYGVRSPYVLYVGTLEPRKNVERLLEAVRLLRRAGTDLSLVLVGRWGWKTRRLRLLILDNAEWVRHLEAVPDDDLPALYTGAEVVALVSRYEGFGMPAAEARACGARVVATDIPELREAAGQDAVFVKPTASGISKGIREAMASSRPPPERRFTWEDAGRVMANLIARAVRGHEV